MKTNKLEQIREVAAKTLARFGATVILGVEEGCGDVTLIVDSKEITEVMRWMRDSLGFDMLVNLCSVDHDARLPRFEVVYVLSEAEEGVNVTLKVRCADGESVPSVCEIFQSANWLEREVYDLMGIPFSAHPDLRRIMMWEEYPYHPLRKDFPVQGIPTEVPGVAFTETAPTEGAPFATVQGTGTSKTREPRSRSIL